VSAIRDLPNSQTVQGTSYFPAIAINAPTGVAAAYVSATSARISWTDNSTNENRFVIEQSVNGGAWTVVGTPTAANATSATVTGLVVGTSYSFRVTAQAIVRVAGTTVDSVLASATSAAASYTHTVPVIPVSPTPNQPSFARAGTTDTATLTWTAAANTTSYLVEWSRNASFTGGGYGSLTVAAPATSTAANAITGLRRNSPYYFRITAVNGAASGTASTSILSGNTP
jgi:hypothetical protein